MKRLMNFLRGMADLRVTGLFPERLINLCAQNGVEFWGVEWLFLIWEPEPGSSRCSLHPRHQESISLVWRFRKNVPKWRQEV